MTQSLTPDHRTDAALVGPIMQAGEMADLVAEAIVIDNPSSEVHLSDHGSYVRIHTAGTCRLTRQTLSELSGRPVRIGDVEPHMAFFAGHIMTTTDDIVWHSSQRAARPDHQEGRPR